MHNLRRRFVQLNAALLAEWFRRLADEIELLVPGRAVAAFPLVFLEGGTVYMASITVEDTSAPLSATVKFLDAKGAETSPDATPAWSSSDDTVASVVASDDGLTATVTVGQPGAAIINVTAVETDEAGVETTVVAEGTVTVQAGDAVIGEVEFATP